MLELLAGRSNGDSAHELTLPRVSLGVESNETRRFWLEHLESAGHTRTVYSWSGGVTSVAA